MVKRNFAKVQSGVRFSYPAPTSASETWQSESPYKTFSSRLEFLRRFDSFRWYHNVKMAERPNARDCKSLKPSVRIRLFTPCIATVEKPVYSQDLKSCAVRHGGSTPPSRTNHMPQWRKILGRRICSRDRLVAGSTPVWGTNIRIEVKVYNASNFLVSAGNSCV